MKRLIFLSLILISCVAGYGQVTVTSTFNGNSNQLNSHYSFTPQQILTENIDRDLFFSISPNGIPQYGRNVRWNLNGNTDGVARFFHVKKGDWERSAIRTADETIIYNGYETYDPSATPNIPMGNDWIRFGTSWNFSHDNYNIAIVSITNPGEETIAKGTVRFKHPDHNFISIPEWYIYNDWMEFEAQFTSNNFSHYEFVVRNLAPGEVRHLYLKVDFAQPSSFTFPRTTFVAEFVGYQRAEVQASGIIPPHDPNQIQLLTALENTPPINNCEDYSDEADLYAACQLGNPVWVDCTVEQDAKCPYLVSLNYPYCNQDSEVLKYRVTCLNEGKGVAQDVVMNASFFALGNPFEDNFFHYEGSHPLTGEFLYPRADFEFLDINLPGLNDPDVVRLYHECIADATFEVKTLCDIEETINAFASITFYDTAGSPVDPIATNVVTAVPEQGVYTNYSPNCVGCGIFGFDNQNRSVDPEYKTSNDGMSLNVTMQRTVRDAKINLQILDVSGRLLMTRQILPDGSDATTTQFDISTLNTGIYFLTIQNGRHQEVRKFAHH